MFKKVMMFVTLVISFFALFNGTTPLQFAPIIAFMFLAYQNVFQEWKNNSTIVLLSVFMLIINLSIMAGWDILMWGLIMIAFWKE